MSENASIDSVFCAAIEIESATEQEAYLERACGGNTERRHQVDRLLAAHYRGGSILDASVQDTVGPLILEKPGTKIGPYKLLQKIGEGGMGIVFMAEQTEPIKRRVALKIIKPGMDSRQVIARLRPNGRLWP